jgi:hypothetical protein
MTPGQRACNRDRVTPVSDGTTTYTWDALSRTTSRNGVAYQYNGDSMLVAQTTTGTTTRYAQDLTLPLPQILTDRTTNYLYGVERLATTSDGTRTWYIGDALGSVRQTLGDTGGAQSALSYDPWGVPQGGATPPMFGYTGEPQDASGFTYLRMRWYNPAAGTFPGHRWRMSESWSEIPYSNHPYSDRT